MTNTLRHWENTEHLKQLKATMTEDKKLKVEFAPGCFDHFDGTQEELDQMIKDIMDMFENKSKEELEAMSTQITAEDLDTLDEDVQQQIVRSLSEDNSTTKRNIQ